MGLDISNDGKYVIVTSQGRSGGGGNAVNIYEVNYDEPEPVLKNTDGAAVLNELESPDSTQQAKVLPGAEESTPGNTGYYIAGGAAAILALAFFIRKRNK